MLLGIYCSIFECGCSYRVVLWLRYWDKQEVGIRALVLQEWGSLKVQFAK